MTRVAFLIAFSDRLLGQLNYFRNLFEALNNLDNNKIQPIIITGTSIDTKLLKNFPSCEIIKSHFLDRKSLPWLTHKIFQHIFSKDFILNHILKRNNIAVLSHSGSLGINSSIKTIGWIPDFQHKHLPELFSEIEIKYRDQMHKKLCEECTCLVLSSHTALNDLKTFHPNCSHKARVLQFVAGPMGNIDLPTLGTLEKQYHFSGPYFHLPNQFWVHKNHKVVIEALRILKNEGLEVQVVLTGKTFDPRQPNHYKQLLSLVESYNLSNAIHILGVVPYSHLISLMKNAAAIINPSFFEGWSSTVEEAKTLGKRIILSDIPIHREQNPPGAFYFDPQNPNLLAQHIKEIIQSRTKEEENLRTEAEKNLVERKRIFAETYVNIVLNTIKADPQQL